MKPKGICTMCNLIASDSNEWSGFFLYGQFQYKMKAKSHLYEV